MTPIQQMFLGAGAASTKTYVDDVFSTYVYKGTAGSNSVNNGINLSEEGGLVWFKERSGGANHQIFDTLRGATKQLRSDGTNAEETRSYGLAFNTNGYSLNSGDGNINGSSNTYASWTFRKVPGFFDVVTYTGNGGGARTINHNLGSIPGFVALKSYSNITNWVCYHKDFSSNQYNSLNSTAELYTDANQSVNSVTSTQFTVGSDQNTNGYTFVVYLWAGGASTAATAKSVDFDGNDYLEVAGPGDLGTSTDFTQECWAYVSNHPGNSGQRIFSSKQATNSTQDTQIRQWDNNWEVYAGQGVGNRFSFSINDAATIGWHHLVLCREGNVCRFFDNGVLMGEQTGSHNVTITTHVLGWGYGSEYFTGKISNARFVSGTCLYTSSFKPPTEPLTNVTNTTLLCCQDSTATAATVAPGTITASGDPTASTSSPFDDPEGFKFGEEEDKSVISCGSYTGDTANKPEINIGWEPQWILVKNTNLSTEQWFIFDSMRGIITDGTDYVLEPSRNVAEAGWDLIDLTPTGFKIKINDDKVNNNGGNYIYMAIRRPDGYVGKPPSAGSGAFTMDVGNASATIPTFDSGFPVDFGMWREPAASSTWTTQARLMGGKAVATESTGAQYSQMNTAFDSNEGWLKNWNSTYQSWMWKRHTGFDVVTYSGNDVDGRWFNHSLNAVPEMIWIKRRSHTGQWVVGHKGLDGGTAPWTHYLTLETTDPEYDYPLFYDTAPTSTTFTVGGHGEVNGNGKTFIAMLFASANDADGNPISKVGSYTGSDSEQTITLGFQPRFIIIKGTTGTRNWLVLDTTRGWASGNDSYIYQNSSAAQGTDHNFGAPTSNGFTVTGDSSQSGGSGSGTFIYYAHA